MNRAEAMITNDLTNKWNKGELTTPKYIRALQEHSTTLEQTIKQDNDLIVSELHKIEDLQEKVKSLEEQIQGL